MNQGSSFATGLEMQERRKRVLTISTGSKAVDAMLGGKSLNGSVKVNTIESRFLRGIHVAVHHRRKVQSCLGAVVDNASLNSLWRVPHRKDTARTYHECSGPATTRPWWCRGKGLLTMLLSHYSPDRTCVGSIYRHRRYVYGYFIILFPTLCCWRYLSTRSHPIGCRSIWRER